MTYLSYEFDDTYDYEGTDWLDESADLAEALRESLDDEYADATPPRDGRRAGQCAGVYEPG